MRPLCKRAHSRVRSTYLQKLQRSRERTVALRSRISATGYNGASRQTCPFGPIPATQPMYLPEFLNLGAGFSKYFQALPALDDDLRRSVFRSRHSVYC